MFEYAKKEITGRLENVREKQTSDIKEIDRIKVRLEKIKKLKKLRFLIDLLPIFITIFSIVSVFVLILFRLNNVYLFLMTIEVLSVVCLGFACVIDSKKIDEDLMKLSKEKLEQLMYSLTSKKYELEKAISNSSVLVERYESALSRMKTVEADNGALDNMSYAFKNATDKDDFIEMSSKEYFSDDTIDESFDDNYSYQNRGNAKVKKMGAR